jgi:hypothetical protein
MACDWDAATVLGIELPVLGRIAGEAVPVRVAGQAIVGAVGAGRPGLVLHQQGS